MAVAGPIEEIGQRTRWDPLRSLQRLRPRRIVAGRAPLLSSVLSGSPPYPRAYPSFLHIKPNTGLREDAFGPCDLDYDDRERAPHDPALHECGRGEEIPVRNRPGGKARNRIRQSGFGHPFWISGPGRSYYIGDDPRPDSW